ncbi:dienelactone hydrolase family protein [soil metagenome]
MQRIIGAALATCVAGAAQAQDVGYEIEGEAFEGYFAAAEAPRALVLVIHDWDGLDDYERERADMIAALGYDAFAVDLFGAGERPETMEARQAATGALYGDRERMRALIEGGLAEAREHSGAGEAVVIGYCFGGAAALELARSGEEEVAGYVSFHGGLATPEGQSWPDEAPPLLILHGGADENPSMLDLATFADEVEAAGLTYDIEVYAGAPHAFTVFGSERYQERADMRSWAAFERFLEETLGGEES